MTLLRRLICIGLLALTWVDEVAAQAWQARYNMTSPALQREFDDLKQNGFSPVEINALEVDGEIRFDAVWRQELTEAWQSWHGMSAAGLQQKFNEFNAWCEFINGRKVPGTVTFAKAKPIPARTGANVC